ncbi:MAG: class II glutamine amidotransferase [Solirubrobacteraceae bacterium]
MCRLFGMSAGSAPVAATFWLLDAPDSLGVQSHRNADGTGVGYFDPTGTAHVDKQPIAAFEDRRFASEARHLRSPTFISHVRQATNGGLTVANTHPFRMENRLFAHNGVINDVARLDQELGDYRALVQGDTDSERYFALITREIQRHAGDVDAGMRSAVNWVAEHLSVTSINFVLITADGLWALRYPETHSLFMLERHPGGAGARQALAIDQRSGHGTRIHSEQARDRPVVIVASECMDDDPAWRPISSGELIHVDGSLAVASERVIAA